jgi:hypothetical protein
MTDAHIKAETQAINDYMAGVYEEMNDEMREAWHAMPEEERKVMMYTGYKMEQEIVAAMATQETEEVTPVTPLKNTEMKIVNRSDVTDFTTEIAENIFCWITMNNPTTAELFDFFQTDETANAYLDINTFCTPVPSQTNRATLRVGNFFMIVSGDYNWETLLVEVIRRFAMEIGNTENAKEMMAA